MLILEDSKFIFYLTSFRLFSYKESLEDELSRIF